MRQAHLTVALIGKAELVQNLKDLDLRTANKVKLILLDSAMNIQRMTKERCPVRKDPKAKVGGRLRASYQIQFLNNGFTSEVGTNVEYAAFVEFGTGQRGAASGLTYLPAEYRHGTIPGQTAQPHLYPSFEEERPKFIERIKREAGDAFRF
jgi:HK97 gp10 family phage protein